MKLEFAHIGNQNPMPTSGGAIEAGNGSTCLKWWNPITNQWEDTKICFPSKN